MLGRVVLALGGTAVGAFTLRVTLHDSGFSFAAENPETRALLVVAGLALTASGVWTWSGRGAQRRVGLLLALVGVGWFVAVWDDPTVGSDVAFTVGLVAYAACPPLVAHLLLSYPGGRLDSAADRVVVAAGYASSVGVLGVLASVFSDPAAAGCTGCPTNLVLVSDRPAASVRTATVGIALVFAWTLVAFAWVIRRLVTSSAGRRRTAAPVAVAGLAFLAATAVTFGTGLGSPYVRDGDAERRLWEAQGMALVALAVGAAWPGVSARGRHRELARLIVDLHQSARTGGMRQALARVLDDADVELGYPSARGGYVDATGCTVDVVSTDGRTTTSLTRAGREVAVLVQHAGAPDDPRLVDEIASAAALGFDHERLLVETRRQLADIRASRTRIVAAGDEERRRLERDLHDGAQQRVVGIALALRLLRRSTEVADSAALAEAEDRVRLALDELRDLARGIYPVALSEEGLAAALDDLTETTPLRVHAAPAGRLPVEIENAVYQLVAEAAAVGPTTLSVVATATSVTVDLLSPGITAALQDVADRLDALEGQVSVEASGDRSRAVVRLPLQASSDD